MHGYTSISGIEAGTAGFFTHPEKG